MRKTGASCWVDVVDGTLLDGVWWSMLLLLMGPLCTNVDFQTITYECKISVPICRNVNSTCRVVLEMTS